MKRLKSVDICRGIAIACMVVADIPVITNVGIIKFFAAFLAAPFFIFIAGVSFELFVFSRKEKYEKNLTLYIETFWKGILLLGITQFIFLAGVLFFSSRFSLGFNSSVFFVIAAGYFLSIFIPSKWIYQIPFIILPFIIQYFNNLIPGISVVIFGSPFPLIPFIAYFFAGRGIIIFYKDFNDIEMKNWKTVIFSGLFVVIFGIIFQLFTLPSAITARTQILGFLFLTGAMIFILSLLSKIDNKKEYSLFLSPFEKIGRIAFSMYYAFFALELIVFPFLNRVIIIHFDPSIQILTYYISIITILLIASIIEKLWRKFDYIYGFEWIIRHGSTFLTKFTMKHIEKKGLCEIESSKR
jgi:hypothetical protein